MYFIFLIHSVASYLTSLFGFGFRKLDAALASERAESFLIQLECACAINIVEWQLTSREFLTQSQDYVKEIHKPLGLSYACEEFTSDNAEDISDGLECNFTSGELCFFLGKCSLESVRLSRNDGVNHARMYGLAQDNSASGLLGQSGAFDGNSPTTAETFDPSECKMCEYVVTNIKEQIPNAKGQTQPAEIRISLTGLCNYLRKPESKKLCSNYVAGTGDDVIEVLANANPTSLCILFLACPSNGSPQPQSRSDPNSLRVVAASRDHIPLGKVSARSLLKGDDHGVEDDQPAAEKRGYHHNITPPMPVLETDDCTICENMAMIVYQMVNMDIPIELDQALQRACTVIHPLYHARCVELMAKYQEQLRKKILVFTRLGITEYCAEFEPPVCAPAPLYGGFPGKRVLSKILHLKDPSHKDPHDFSSANKHVLPSDKIPDETLAASLPVKQVVTSHKVPDDTLAASLPMKHLLPSHKVPDDTLAVSLPMEHILPSHKVPDDTLAASLPMKHILPSHKVPDDTLATSLPMNHKLPSHMVPEDSVSEVSHQRDPKDLCEVCQHVIFEVGALSRDPAVSPKKIHSAIVNSCNSFFGEKFQQCRYLLTAFGDQMEVKLLAKPKIPYYGVCYQMGDALCSANYSNSHLKDKLMDLFLTEFPKELTGNEQTFKFANDVSDFISTVMYFMSPDSLDSYDKNPSDNGEHSVDNDEPCNDETCDCDLVITSTPEPEDEEAGTECEICNEIVNKVKPYIQYPILHRFLQEEIEKSCYDIQPLHFSKCLEFVANYSCDLKETCLYDISRQTEDICSLTEPQFCLPQESPFNPIIDSKKWHSMDDLRDLDKIDEAGKKMDEMKKKNEALVPYDAKNKAVVPFIAKNEALLPSNEEIHAKNEAWMPYDAQNKPLSSVNKEVQAPLSDDVLVPVMPSFGAENVIPNFIPAAASHVSDCNICTEIVQNIEPNIRGSKNPEEIKDLIMRACFSIDREHFSQCLDFLPKYGPNLRDSILADSTTTPNQICLDTKTLSCSPLAPEESATPAAPLHQKTMNAKFVNPVKRLHPLGSGSLTRDILLKVCEKIIEKIAAGLEEICMTFIDKHFPEENPYGASGSLNLLSGVRDCDVCQEMMTVVSMVKTYQTGRKFHLHDTLYDSCQYLPVNHRWLCKGVLRKYGDVMEPYLESHPSTFMDVCDAVRPYAPCYQFIPKDDSSEENKDNISSAVDSDEESANVRHRFMQRQFVNQVLTMRYLSQQQLLSDEKLSDPEGPPEKHDDYSPDCLLCQDMVNEIRKRLMLDHSKSIKDVTNDVCQFLPEVAHHNCSEIVLASGSKIEEGLRWFVYDPASYVCEQSELCDPYRMDLSSKDPCKEGPDFWCMSFQNAEQCNQIDFCQAKFRKPGNDDDDLQ